MKYIFLDIDGVMKPGRCYLCPQRKDNMDGGFDPLAIAAVNRICEKTGASIVFNTVWNQLNIEEIARKESITAAIAGKTKYPRGKGRLEEIEIWLKDNPASHWIALDDMPINHDNAIWVEPDNGISTTNYRDACRLLGNPDSFMILL